MPCPTRLGNSINSKRLDVVGIWYTNIDPENHPFLVETHLPTQSARVYLDGGSAVTSQRHLK